MPMILDGIQQWLTDEGIAHHRDESIPGYPILEVNDEEEETCIDITQDYRGTISVRSWVKCVQQGLTVLEPADPDFLDLLVQALVMHQAGLDS